MNLAEVSTFTWVILAISTIAIAPFAIYFVKAFIFFIVCKLNPIQKLTVQHVHDGKITNTITLELNSSIPIVRQIAIQTQKGKEGENV
ncbi:TPA: hypothetical protein OUB89_000974 [Proteus mirabilis]|uniref:hypothetical protein n=1 Tax=Proteus mirabilis TaxID=584 RepID=UPI00158398E3|nr:hypothetical protein [Proteus mirabilis]MBG2815428.1 hypothetical protein [Proteus mirabilis]MBG2863953.1 hypothetical protein [Proteus mirabilis]MBL1397912.1 hypothetical protein [Proteus mirabilis]MCL8565465.1 hypothetical protein [Proteus mirabilis]MCL8627054.1 hypothetical protein [Proteus mirabilis]